MPPVNCPICGTLRVTERREFCPACGFRYGQAPQKSAEVVAEAAASAVAPPRVLEGPLVSSRMGDADLMGRLTLEGDVFLIKHPRFGGTLGRLADLKNAELLPPAGSTALFQFGDQSLILDSCGNPEGLDAFFLALEKIVQEPGSATASPADAGPSPELLDARPGGTQQAGFSPAPTRMYASRTAGGFSQSPEQSAPYSLQTASRPLNQTAGQMMNYPPQASAFPPNQRFGAVYQGGAQPAPIGNTSANLNGYAASPLAGGAGRQGIGSMATGGTWSAQIDSYYIFAAIKWLIYAAIILAFPAAGWWGYHAAVKATTSVVVDFRSDPNSRSKPGNSESSPKDFASVKGRQSEYCKDIIIGHVAAPQKATCTPEEGGIVIFEFPGFSESLRGPVSISLLKSLRIGTSVDRDELRIIGIEQILLIYGDRKKGEYHSILY